jgi:hypothetical protein
MYIKLFLEDDVDNLHWQQNTSSCEYCDEILGSVKGGKFIAPLKISDP